MLFVSFSKGLRRIMILLISFVVVGLIHLFFALNAYGLNFCLFYFVYCFFIFLSFCVLSFRFYALLKLAAFNRKKAVLVLIWTVILIFFFGSSSVYAKEGDSLCESHGTTTEVTEEQLSEKRLLRENLALGLLVTSASVSISIFL